MSNNWSSNMVISYKKLWYKLIDKKLKKSDIIRITGISPSTMANLTADKNVSLDVLLRICVALHCNLCDIIESIPEEKDNWGKAKFQE